MFFITTLIKIVPKSKINMDEFGLFVSIKILGKKQAIALNAIDSFTKVKTAFSIVS